MSFAYTDGGRAVLDGFDLTIPAGTSMAIVGQNGAGKTTLAKLLCRLYDPTPARSRSTATPLTSFELTAWRVARHRGVPGLHPLRAAAARQRRTERCARRRDPSRARVPPVARSSPTATSTPSCRKGYPGGTDLSGGQWQRIALARALCAVRQGAGVVLLDEPTAQLDVRGEAEIFERVLAATRALHDDPDLPPLLDRAPGRPDLRDRGRQGRRARHATTS